MKHNRRGTDRRQAKNNAVPWAGPERRKGADRRRGAEMMLLALEPRVLFSGGMDYVQQPDIDMPASFDVAATQETLAAQAGAAAGPTVPVSGAVPILHSRPSAAAKLVIDFDGDGAYTWGGYSVPATPAYDQDGDPSTFNTAELASINEIFLRVSEKYSPFNIDVTTEDPGSYGNKVAVKVIVGGDGAWLGAVAGGISYIGSFYNSTDNKSYVFPANLANGYAKYTAEAVAHEAGHAFGLQHQGQYSGTTLVQEYNPGNSQVAPVMGNSYYAARGLWWYGTPSNNSSATQDDLARISGSSNGFGYRVDDYGDSTGTATGLTVSSGVFSAGGVIEQYTDADYFSLSTSGAGTLTLNLSVAQYGAMLDGSLYVYNGSGVLLGSADTASLGESLTLTLGSSGTYYVRVTSHGGYGDMGQYTLTGSLSAAANDPNGPIVVADPSGLSVTPVSAGRIVLAWVDNSGNEDGFVVQRSADNGATWTTVATTGADVTGYNDWTVSGGTTYEYRVQAYSAGASSDFTAAVAGTTVPSTPGTPVTTANSTTQVTLTWSDVVGETSYSVERSTDGGATWTQITTTGANVTSYVDTGLSAGTGYVYRVRALDGTGWSAYSSNAGTVTVPAAPGTVGAVATSSSQVAVTWSDVSGETGYLVERSADGTSGWTQVGSTSAGVTTFVDAGRAGGTRYYYRVRATNGSGSSAYTSTASALTVPVVPTGLAVSAVSATQATVTWVGVTGATSYVVERSGDGVNWSPLTTTGTTTVNDITLSAGTWYFYRVRASNASGSSATCASAGVLTYPIAPASATAAADSASKVTVTWAAATGAAGYDVERSADGSTGWTRVATGVAGTSYIDEGLSANTPYYYRVRSVNGSGASGYTSQAGATTMGVQTSVVDPTLLTATANGPGRVDVAWQDNSNNEDGFVVDRSADGGSTWVTVVTTDPGVTTYADTGLASGATYVYRVRAYSGAVTSDYAAGASATTFPGIPVGVRVTTVSTGAIRVNWDAVTGATAYEVERSATGAGGWAPVGTTAGDVTEFASTGLWAGTQYYFRVRSVGVSGASDYSAAASTVTVPAAPGGVAALGYAFGQMYVSWGYVTGATGYVVERSADGASWGQVGTTAGAGQTGFNDATVAAGTSYYYRVRAVNAGGASDYAVSAAAALSQAAAPANVTATATSPSQITVTWDAATGATGYVVERSTDLMNWSAVGTVIGGATEYDDWGLTVATRYYYRVRSVNDAGTSGAGYNVGATTEQAAPVAPANLGVVPVSTEMVQLSWGDRSGNESGFKVEYSTNGGRTWNLAGTVGADTTVVRVTGLESGQRYTFRVSAYNEMGFSGATNKASGRALRAKDLRSKALQKKLKKALRRDLVAAADATPTPVVLDIRKVKAAFKGLTKGLVPDAATDLTATPYSTSAVQLTWTDNSDSELGYRVEYSANGRVWLLAGYVKPNQTGCRVTGLSNGQAYKFRVSAYNMAGTTKHSATTRARVPRKAPTGSNAKPSWEPDQDTTLNVLRVKDVAPGLPANLRAA